MDTNRTMTLDRDARLRFAQIDDRAAKRLRAIWPHLKRKLPGILDRFYRHLASEPELAMLVGARAGQLKQAQRVHWEKLFAGTFDRHYMEGVYRIGLAHKKIGLEPRWYIGGYKYVLNELVNVTCTTYRLTPWRIAPTIRAINAALMLDVDLAVSTYFWETTQEIMNSVDLVGAGLAAVANGDLTRRIDAQMDGPFAKLKTDFNQAISRLDEAMQTVTASTSQIATSAGEIATASDHCARRTEQQAANLEETAATLAEITATVRKTSGNAGEVGAIVQRAKSAAGSGGEIVRTATQAMDEIERSSRQITDIIGVIDEIAFQTNLLALNAGVEAARAGDAGKGFAVVASEVRALAQRSGEAARRIKTLIKSSAEQVTTGVKLVGESGDALRQIVSQVVEINDLVAEMAHASKQQSTNIDGINSAMGQMDQVTQQNAAMVEEGTAAARSMAIETEKLKETVSFFKVTRARRATTVVAFKPRRQERPMEEEDAEAF